MYFFIHLRQVFGASQVALVTKNLLAGAEDVRDVGSIPGSGKLPGEGNGKPTSAFLTGESYGQRSLVGYSSWSYRLGHD